MVVLDTPWGGREAPRQAGAHPPTHCSTGWLLRADEGGRNTSSCVTHSPWSGALAGTPSCCPRHPPSTSSTAAPLLPPPIEVHCATHTHDAFKLDSEYLRVGCVSELGITCALVKLMAWTSSSTKSSTNVCKHWGPAVQVERHTHRATSPAGYTLVPTEGGCVSDSVSR
jgi:hypothetical protein